MIRAALLSAGLILGAAASCHASGEVKGDAFDVLASVMEAHHKEISTKDVLDANKKEGSQYREALIAGWWEFMQARSNARPGEYCAASFLRAKRVVAPGQQDGIKDGVVVTLFGPGGNYRGALLAFSPLGQDSAEAFPKLASGQPVLVTLTQGNVKPVTLHAIYLETRPKAPPLLAFAVPNIDALLKGMEDRWRFDVGYEGRSIANIEWHDGLKARAELQKCLAGSPFDDKRHWKP
ncbi:MAG: hypothetical protein KF891_12730 [Rhizobacter sp.]|nr:hypothetical protein [Rhizobacter sp.]